MTVILHTPDYDTTTLLTSVRRILRSSELCSMATTGRYGAHINTAYFSYSTDLTFYFVSDRRSRHIRQLVDSNRVALAVYDSRQSWDAYHAGLQVIGTCYPAEGPELAQALSTYSKRFPAYRQYVGGLTPAEQQRSPHRFYAFRPKSVKILDEHVFGEEVFVSARVIRAT